MINVTVIVDDLLEILRRMAGGPGSERLQLIICNWNPSTAIFLFFRAFSPQRRTPKHSHLT